MPPRLPPCSSLRAAITSEVVEARGLDAVRAALLRLFASFTLTPADDVTAPDEPPDSVLDPIDLGEEYLIWAEPRATALVGLDENFVPIYAREALHADWQNDHDRLTT